MIYYSLPQRRPNDFSNVIPTVKEIIQKVKEKGDSALYELTENFDKVKVNSIKVNPKELEDQASRLDEKVAKALDLIYDQIRAFHETTVPPNIGGGLRGISFGILWKSIEKIGIYVPGGRHSYPSTLLMAGVPAEVAGVKEIYFASPPNPKGEIDPALAYVALKLKIKEAYKIGGAQAIAALAYGTESVKKVDKIIGPGNIYVQAAKYLVSSEVGIDGIEGPTELVIIADESADPINVYFDMLAQAEHGSNTFIVLLSHSDELISKINEKLISENYGNTNDYYIIKTKDLEESIRIANQIAPEHLSLYVKNYDVVVNKISNAGAISLGSTPPALIDYSAGPNHILPTNEWARIRGGVTVYDYLKPIMYANSIEPNNEIIEASMVLANYEGFIMHGKSIGVRYGK